MTDDEFDARYCALKAALLSTWEQHAGGVPADNDLLAVFEDRHG